MFASRATFSRIAAVGLCAAAAAWLGFAGGRAGSAGQPAPVAALDEEAAQKKVAPDDRDADRDTVKKTIDGFAAAFRKGDGKAVSGFFTAEGEYMAEDGTNFRGKAALEKAYTEFFAKNPGNSLEVEVEAVRFPSRETAVVEGHFKLRRKGELVVSRCSMLLAREDGKWLIAIAREWPGDGHGVRDLEWMLGTWEMKREGLAVTTTYEWTPNKSFIRCRFTITHNGETTTGTQMYGKDPTTGLLRSWTFEDDGGIGDADITRDGKKWVHVCRGAFTDGRLLRATNIMTPVDADSFLWQSVERSLDDEPLPDLPPVKVVRVKGK